MATYRSTHTAATASDGPKPSTIPPTPLPCTPNRRGAIDTAEPTDHLNELITLFRTSTRESTIHLSTLVNIQNDLSQYRELVRTQARKISGLELELKTRTSKERGLKKRLGEVKRVNEELFREVSELKREARMEAVGGGGSDEDREEEDRELKPRKRKRKRKGEIRPSETQDEDSGGLGEGCPAFQSVDWSSEPGSQPETLRRCVSKGLRTKHKPDPIDEILSANAREAAELKTTTEAPSQAEQLSAENPLVGQAPPLRVWRLGSVDDDGAADITTPLTPATSDTQPSSDPATLSAASNPPIAPPPEAKRTLEDIYGLPPSLSGLPRSDRCNKPYTDLEMRQVGHLGRETPLTWETIGKAMRRTPLACAEMFGRMNKGKMVDRRGLVKGGREEAMEGEGRERERERKEGERKERGIERVTKETL
jgi:hypothetical protein